MKKTIKVLGLTLLMSLSMSIISMAAQTDRWTEQNEQNNGNVTNSWFQDLDSS